MPAAGGMGLRQEEKTNKLSLIHEQQINEIHEVVGWGCCLCCRRRLWALAAPWAPPKKANANKQTKRNGAQCCAINKQLNLFDCEVEWSRRKRAANPQNNNPINQPSSIGVD